MRSHTPRAAAWAVLAASGLAGCNHSFLKPAPEPAGKADPFLATAEAQRLRAEAAAPQPAGRAASPEELAASDVTLAAHLTARGDFAQAETRLRQALERKPDHVPALVGVAKLHRAKGDLPAARAALAQALDKDRTSPLAWNEVATLRSADGDYAGAVEALNAALAAKPNHPMLLENLGGVYTLAGDHEAAYEAYRRALGPAEARYRIAGALYSKGDIAGARRQLQAGAVEEPNHGPTLRMLKAIDESEIARR